jgi:hypothetical protein
MSTTDPHIIMMSSSTKKKANKKCLGSPNFFGGHIPLATHFFLVLIAQFFEEDKTLSLDEIRGGGKLIIVQHIIYTLQKFRFVLQS